jgi:hypothetical protein
MAALRGDLEGLFIGKFLGFAEYPQLKISNPKHDLAAKRRKRRKN